MMRFAAVMLVAGLAGAQAVPTLKTKARIVPIDVVVTDKQGRPVKGLQAADFSLAENGAAQTVTHFEAHASLTAEEVAKLPPMPKLAANIFTDYSPAPENGPLTVLVLDALNTKMSDQSVVLKQMLKYLETPHPGVRMEIFELNDGLKLLQGFSSDQALLRAALLSKRAAPQASGQMNTAMSDEDTPITGIETGGLSLRAATVISIRRSVRPGQDLNFNQGSIAGFQLWKRQADTLDAMAGLARYLRPLPGRKNLLWFSASFTIPMSWPDGLQKLHDTMEKLEKSQVAVYPIVAEGLMPDLNTVRSPTVLLKRLDNEKRTMEQMAEDTGGKVFANSNDIAGAVEQAVDDGSNYYTLTYTPTNRDWKGDFRKVEVKLAEKGYRLTYRPGYYAEDDDKPARKGSVAAEAGPMGDGAADAAKTTLRAAMQYGSPQPNAIVFKVAVNPATGRLEKVAAKANSISPKVQAPFERYVVSVAALPSAFTFVRAKPGKVHMAARLVTCVYSADGALINNTSINVDKDIDEDFYKTVLAEGVKFKQEISVPAKGESFLRIGVEDVATNRVGVVEIPVAVVAKADSAGGEVSGGMCRAFSPSYIRTVTWAFGPGWYVSGLRP
jgi:VWFA-related protein